MFFFHFMSCQQIPFEWVIPDLPVYFLKAAAVTVFWKAAWSHVLISTGSNVHPVQTTKYRLEPTQRYIRRVIYKKAFAHTQTYVWTLKQFSIHICTRLPFFPPLSFWQNYKVLLLKINMWVDAWGQMKKTTCCSLCFMALQYRAGAIFLSRIIGMTPAGHPVTGECLI